MGTQKWAEAKALFQRAMTYANKAKNDSMLSKEMKVELDGLLKWIEGRQFMAHANSILESEGSSKQSTDKKDPEKAAVPLVERMDVYYEDPQLAAGKPNLYPFPPDFEPIPCKPLFFDLAREQVTFPNLEAKMAAPGSQGAHGQGGSSGWLGGWLGGWGKK